MPKLLNKLARPLIMAAYPRGTVRRIHRGDLRGLRFVVRDAMGFAFAWGVDAFHRAFLAKKIQPGEVVYDVGGNRGQMAMFFSRRVGSAGHVYSFEPMAPLADDLRTNCQLNALDNVTIVRAAAADQDGELAFEFDEGHSTQGKLSNVESAHSVPEAKSYTVAALRLDSFVATHRPPAFMKIDVEGGAGSVLRGARDLLQKYSPRIFIELHGPEEQQAVNDELISRGYMVQDLNGARVADAVAKWASPLWCERARSSGGATL